MSDPNQRVVDMTASELEDLVRRAAGGDRPPVDRMLTVAEFAEKMAVCERTIRNAIHRGEIPATRFGGVYRIPNTALHGTMERSDLAIMEDE